MTDDLRSGRVKSEVYSSFGIWTHFPSFPCTVLKPVSSITVDVRVVAGSMIHRCAAISAYLSTEAAVYFTLAPRYAV